MKKISFLFLLSVFSLSFLTACGDDDKKDTEKPKVDNVLPANNATLYIGEAFTFKADLSDNTGLGSYRIDIHFNDGNHSHSVKLVEPRGVEDIAYAYTNNWTVTGTSQSVQQAIEIPLTQLDATDNKQKPVKVGNYHLVIYVADKEGNETVIARDIVLANR